jgi:hypothetical protein
VAASKHARLRFWRSLEINPHLRIWRDLPEELLSLRSRRLRFPSL